MLVPVVSVVLLTDDISTPFFLTKGTKVELPLLLFGVAKNVPNKVKSNVILTFVGNEGLTVKEKVDFLELLLPVD